MEEVKVETMEEVARVVLETEVVTMVVSMAVEVRAVAVAARCR